jgi:hypothetical protein
MTIDAEDVADVTRMLSAERLRALTALTGSAKIAIELHQETLRVGASLMTVIATIEIALRNSVCENLTQHFAVPNWLRQPPVPFQWRAPELKKVAMAHDSARRAEYSKLTQAQKHALDALAIQDGRQPARSHLDTAKDRRKHIAVSDGKIIAELTLYFWKRLYGPDYDQSLWRTSLKRTFPCKKLSRAHVAIQLEHIYQARNRLAHHEPVLHGRFADTVQAIEFVIQHLEALKPSSSTPLANLLAGDIAKVMAEAESLHARLDTFRPKADAADAGADADP